MFTSIHLINLNQFLVFFNSVDQQKDNNTNTQFVIVNSVATIVSIVVVHPIVTTYGLFNAFL